ncbi:PAQR family membrane homeostasis protein TrhA [Marmoricola sp. RAF53]|uniref:PAQR family membrane homeostasis protein TrhA n=1 Tax=Marmoricola sp. RAF53 TaxID=3233059 RepID=UPI003F957AA0
MTAHVPMPEKATHAGHAAHAAHEAALALHEKMNAAKPRLRGWIHAATSPLALAAGIVLISLSPTAATKIGSAAFAGTAILLFTVSGIYHRGTWSPRTWAFLRRFDHANIFLLIAGSYTPFALILLDGSAQVVMLAMVWTGAILGMLFRVFWIDAPRWLYTPLYVALGWAAIFYADDFASGGAAVITLIAVGGALYTVGGLVYGLKWPNPSPTWFGFHEIFHVFTIAAFICHYVAASLATYRLR